MPSARAIRVPLQQNPYVVRFQPGVLRRPGRALAGLVRGRRAFLLADARVAALYAQPVLRSLRRHADGAELLAFPPGERSKTLRQTERLARALVDLGADRNSIVLALGGGVTTDLAGFVAATLFRGIPWAALPTTVLAQVDAAVGGKTGVDLPEGKNLVGAFHQPLSVLADPRAVQTLPERHYRAGLAEIVKMGAAIDAAFFAWLERHAERLLERHEPTYQQAAARAVRLKAAIVAADEREAGRRAWLNYGHTVGHAVETLGGYRKWLHGEAVAMGISAAAGIAQARRICSEDTARRQRALLERLHLPVTLPRLSARALMRCMGADKKARSGQPAFVLTSRIGVVSVHRTLTGKELVGVLRALGAGP